MSEAEVVQTDSGREVRMTYRRACHDYTIGFATALFMATTVLAFVILWKPHVPESLYNTSVVFFVVLSLAGFVIMGVGYMNPVWFYELLEDPRNDE